LRSRESDFQSRESDLRSRESDLRSPESDFRSREYDRGFRERASGITPIDTRAVLRTASHRRFTGLRAVRPLGMTNGALM
jgi:hypothetical protein